MKAVKTRNSGTWSESAFWGFIRSMLRKGSFRWLPIKEAKLAARVPWPGPHGRKWGFVCASCGKIFADKEVAVDHIEPCGALKSSGDIAGFVDRLYPEGKDKFQVLCKKKCHKEKTNLERKEKHE